MKIVLNLAQHEQHSFTIVKSFSYLPTGRKLVKDLNENQVLLDVRDIPDNFYTRFREYIYQDNKLVLSDVLVSKK
jgi:hypothetical protein